MSTSPLANGLGSRDAIPSAALKVEQHVTVEASPDEYSFSPGAGMLRLSRHVATSGGQWWAGDFVDYRGIVSVMREATFTRLDTVAGNRCHTRTWHQYFGDRTVSQLCRSFLSDLHGSPSPD